MGKLIYTFNVSLDGFVETVDDRLDWAVVDDELLTWFKETRTFGSGVVYLGYETVR